jgi:hypothetical protein
VVAHRLAELLEVGARHLACGARGADAGGSVEQQAGVAEVEGEVDEEDAAGVFAGEEGGEIGGDG